MDIPITFSGDTPLSGESMPADATEVEPEPPSSAVARSDAAEFEEYPTEVQQSPFDEPRSEDARTTQRRGPEFERQLAQARVDIRDTDVTGRPVLTDSDATGRLSPLRSSRRPPPEQHDDTETMIKSRNALPLSKRKSSRKPTGNPDDTIKMDSEAPSAEGDPTQLMASRTPKAPGR